MLLIRGLLLAIGFFVVQAHVVHAASDCDGAGEEIAPMVFGEKFAHLKLAIAPWLSEYADLINDFNKRLTRSVSGFSAGLVPMMSDLEERRIGLIIAGEELRLPGPAAALLRQLMCSEYKVYVEELKKVAKALREQIRDCHTRSGCDSTSPS